MFISYEVVKLHMVEFTSCLTQLKLCGKAYWNSGSTNGLAIDWGSKPKCPPGGKILAKEVLIRDQDQFGSIAPKS